jgi:photosystem II stability/assembly factor-like uncharacterized protein
MNAKGKTFLVALGAIVVGSIASTFGQGAGLTTDSLKEFKLRNIGPMLTTGRVQDTTVDPKDSSVIYVASAAGGLWKSVNHGYSFKPIFDNGGSFNLCCIVVDPKDSNVLWLGTGENSNPRAAMYGDGLYKSTDAGDTWKKVGLDSSEHIAEIIVDPRNSNTVFVASQGPLWSSGGDRGVFKTTDGGATWKNVLTISADTGANGLVMDPANPDVLYATTWQRRRAVGQFVGGGPESGVYKSTDGGNKWTKLTKGLPSGDMGRIAIAIDGKVKPSRVYLLLTAASQATRASGKDESGFYRSDDAGATFSRMQPDPVPAVAPADAGAMAGKTADNKDSKDKDKKAKAPAKLAATPSEPIAAFCGGAPADPAAPPAGRGGGGGRGGRGGPYTGGDPGYYHEIFVDPIRPDTIWSVNTNLECSGDGGKNWKPVASVMNLSNPDVHVDFHDVWVDPKDKRHMIFSNDGGVYETYDEGKYFRHFDNLPVTQFYRVAVDNAYPFYKVCGGAQDNNSMCGPSRTANSVGIRTSDWFITGGGDGFQSRVDPLDPNIVYAQWQTGNIERLDLRTGVSKVIRPPQASGGRGIPTPQQAESMNKGALPDEFLYPKAPDAEPQGGRGAGGNADRANWDVPYIISPHSPTRLYWATNYVYRSDDRGDNWVRISGDISRQLNPADIPIMGKKWDPATTVSWNNATTALSNAVSLDESPLAEGLIYVGTDDGLLQVTEDGGKNWRKTESFPGAPANTYVSDIEPSPRDSNVVFVALNDWQRGNYTPFLYRSDDRGKTFTSIVGDLPTTRNNVWSIAQDYVNSNLLFLGTEFALWTSVDGGKHWVQFKTGLPTAQIRDIAIQKRESDLAIGTFGRSFYILDDYSALREVTNESLAAEGQLYPTRSTAFVYEPASYEQAAWMNETMPNPPVGAMLTYSLGAPAPGVKYVITITDNTGKKVRTMDISQTAGLHRANWDLRGDPAAPPPAGGRGGGGGRGNRAPLVEAGRYTATLGKQTGEALTSIGKPQTFQVTELPPIVR